MIHRRHRHSRGYILIVTLGALVLAATVITTLVCSAIDHTREARAASDELQRRWGVISCRQAVLPNAEYILAYHEAQFHEPAATQQMMVQLGSIQFHLLISDEQAKANVNAVLATADRSMAEDRIRRAMACTGNSGTIRLRPATVDVMAHVSGPATRPVFQSIAGWGQVTDAANPARLLSGAASLLTCWGDGRVNVSRAGAAAMSLGAQRCFKPTSNA